MKDKNTLKLIAFGLVIALCLGFVVMRLAGAKRTQAAPPPSQETTAPGQTSVAQPTPESAVTEGMALASDTKKRDPFAPAFSLEAPGPQKQMAMASSTARISSHVGPISTPLPVNNSLFGTRVEPVSQAGNATPDASRASAEQAFPEFRLTGILRGPANIAIIRAGDRERHIVREGDYINGRFKVIAIGPTSVIIDSGKEHKELRLGGDRNAG